MDPLILIVDELHRARADVDKYESELSECEARIDFTPQNARYNRLLLEKELVLKNLCDLRLELSKKATDLKGMAIYAGEQDGKTTYFLDKAPSSSSLSGLSVEEAPEALRPYSNNSLDHLYPPQPPVLSSARRSHAHAAPMHNQGYNSQPNGPPHTIVAPNHHHMGASYIIASPGGFSGPPTQRRPDPTDLPDLPKYLAAKAELSAVMRDFTDNKIHFVGTDNHVIAMAEYQSISKFTKSGEDPAKFMKGEYRTYKTGYVKKTNSYTENKLFFPVFHPYAPQHISGML